MNVYYNNSGLSLFKCPLRYALTHVHGLRTIKEDYFLIGGAFHHYMKVIEPADDLMTLTMMPGKVLPDKFKSQLVDHYPPRLATLALEASRQLGWPDSLVKERFLSFDSTAKLLTDFDGVGSLRGQPAVTVYDTMTLDRCEIWQHPHAGPFVCITDHKTTHKKLSDGKFHIGYKLQSQFPFYASALRYAAANNKLPPEYAPFADLLLKGRIVTRHVFVNHSDKAAEAGLKDQLMIMPPEHLDADELNLAEIMFSEKRDLAVFYHLHPGLARKEGTINGSCWGCPFTSICLLKNEKLEQAAIENWPLGRAPYDPTHQDDSVQ